MKKIFSEVAILIGALLVFIGWLICFFETPDFESQVVNMIYGFGTMAFGAVICYLGNEGSHYYGNR